MSKIVKNTRVVKELVPVEKVVNDGVTITLNEEEATAVISLMGCISGPHSGPRGVMSKLYNQLLEHGYHCKNFRGERTFYIEY